MIEDGFYCVRARPREGCRLVWLPKDEGDFQFSDCNAILTDLGAA